MSAFGTYLRRNFQPLVLSAQVVVDVLVIMLAMYLGYMAGEELGATTKRPPLVQYIRLALLTAAVCLPTFAAFGMYRPVKSLLNVEEFKAIAKSVVVAFLLIITTLGFLRSTEQSATGGFYGLVVPLNQFIVEHFDWNAYSRPTVLLFFVLTLLLTTISRFLSFRFIQNMHRRGIGNRNALVYGTGEMARFLQRKFLLVPTLGLRLVGMVSEDEAEVGTVVDRTPVLGTYADLDDLIARHKISEVFIALPETAEERVMEIIDHLERLGVTFRVVPRFYHLLTQRVRIENLDSIPLITRPDRRFGLIPSVAKRLLDILVAIVALLLTAPLFVVAAILIKRESAGPVFFRQTRIGKDGKPFRMLKFRTMFAHLSKDAPKPADSEDPRITRVGRALRRYSLDEIPQFVNVLLGDMSIVGPRPEMPFIVAGYGPLERERLRAKPGITGLWQISFARQEAIHQNLDYDIYYVENRSLLLDIVIICLTMVAIVKGTGAH